MKFSYVLFALCLVVGAPAWFLVKYQMIETGISAEMNVGLRILLAGLFLGVCGIIKKTPSPSLDKETLALLVLQGLCMYTLNFWLAYWSTQYLVSGLVAVAFSAMIIPNAIMGRVFLGQRISRQTLLSGVFGIVGVSLCFSTDMGWAMEHNEQVLWGGLIAVAATFFSVAGTIFTGKVAARGVSALYIASRGMVIGGVLSIIYSLLFTDNGNWMFMTSPSFWLALFYLAFVVTSLANLLYVYLVRDFGAGNAAFLWVCTPVSCLMVSAVLENYAWTAVTSLGLMCVVLSGVVLNKSLMEKLKQMVVRKDDTAATV